MYTQDGDAYRSFAQVYDMFMNNVPYEEWSDYLESLLKEYGVNDGLVLELGCGTGSVTELLAKKGYDMIGIDNSMDMLEIAMEKKMESGHDILYLLQDMREFELYGTVAAIVSICDSMNYITEDEDLLEVFRLVNNYLDPGGVFIFDLNTIYKYREIMGERTIAENREEGCFIWDNFYDEEEQINEYNLALFIPEGDDGLYRKYEEIHYQRGYELERVKELLDLGINRVIVGTMAIENKALLKELIDKYGAERIVVSIDAKNGKVATHGWEQVSDIDSVDLCKELEQIGVKTIVYTDISKDGMLSGPNFDIYEELSKKTSLDIIASGGVTSIDDIKRLLDMNMYGAIIGKALYDNRIDLKEVLDLC